MDFSWEYLFHLFKKIIIVSALIVPGFFPFLIISVVWVSSRVFGLPMNFNIQNLLISNEMSTLVVSYLIGLVGSSIVIVGVEYIQRQKQDN